MPSHALSVLRSRQTGLKDVSNSINRSIRRRMSKGSLSPTDADEDRITKDYIKESYLDNITSKKTALKAVKSLKTNPKRGDRDDFRNFLRGVNEDNFAEKLLSEYGRSKINIVNSKIVKIRSGIQRAGIKINSRVYLIAIRDKYLQARSFRTGRVMKIRKSYLNRII